MRKPSKIAWERVKKTLTPRQRLVAVAIRKRKKNTTLLDLVRILKIEKNSISPRITELERLGIIKDEGLHTYPNYRQPFTKWRCVK